MRELADGPAIPLRDHAGLPDAASERRTTSPLGLGHPIGRREFARRIGYVTEMASRGSNPHGSVAAPILEAARVTLLFGGVKALSDVSFAVREHELFSIIGPNGAGKTSIVNCISGRYRP